MPLMISISAGIGLSLSHENELPSMCQAHFLALEVIISWLSKKPNLDTAWVEMIHHKIRQACLNVLSLKYKT